ncbi:MAG: hypothetical protein AB8F78_16035 [Saprospiraceae bacterium]
MPRTKLTDEQKDMIRELPTKEKDKLLLRLIVKDDVLLEQLTFKYLEHEATTEERADLLREHYRRLFAPIGLSPGQMMLRLRKASGMLGRHVRVTKDKLGEVAMLVDMIHFLLDQNLDPMRKRHRSPARWYKFSRYVVKRLPTLMKKADKLHPDLWLDFEGQLNEVLTMIWDSPEMSEEAELAGLVRRWEGPGE